MTSASTYCPNCGQRFNGREEPPLTANEHRRVVEFERFLRSDEGIDWCLEFAGRLGMSLDKIAPNKFGHGGTERRKQRRRAADRMARL